MKQQIFILLALILGLQVNAQNIGIGTNNPSRAKLEVHGAVGATSAIFGGDTTGVSIQRNWPGIGFNQYYNNGSKYISKGHAAVQYLNPENGGFSMDFFSSGNANATCTGTHRAFTFYPTGIALLGENYYNANLAVSKGPAQQATACFFGETYHSFFNHDYDQNTYIRAGKANGKVYINDIPGSKVIMSGFVGINTSTPGYPLEIYQLGGGGNTNGINLVVPSVWDSWQISVNPFYDGNLFLSSRYSVMGFFSSSDGSYHNFSDRRLKKDIQPLPGILQKIMSLEPVSYEMINNNPKHKKSLGFIAQDVKKLFPELVTVATDTLQGYKNIDSVHSVNYAGFGVLAIKAIQEQQQLINELKEVVAALNQSKDNLLKRITILEANTAFKPKLK